MLTLCILNYNGMDSLKESILSVLAQTRPPDRFVVIDNASTDGSRQIAVDMGVEVVDADNRYKFITGLNTAINLKWYMTQSTSRLFFMQNDVMLDKNCLEFMLQDCPERNFIAQPVIYKENKEIDNSGMNYIWPGLGSRRHNKWWNEVDSFQECGLVTTICFMISNKDHYYDERFSPAYYEDIDFYLETKRSMKHVLIPSAKAIHKGNHTFSQTLKKREISKICLINRNKLIRKHYRGIDRALRLTVSTCLYVMAEAIRVITQWRVPKNDRH